MIHVPNATAKPYVKSASCPWIREDNSLLELSSVMPYMQGLCLEIGSGGNRYSKSVLATDSSPTADADLVWDFDTMGPYPFKDGTFSAILSSHCLEDAPPDRIQAWFSEWMRLVKPNGHLCLLLPSMSDGRYPDINDLWTAEDELVKSGERPLGAPKGNSAHRITMGMTVLMGLVKNYHKGCLVVQADTLPKDQMTMDFVVKKLS